MVKIFLEQLFDTEQRVQAKVTGDLPNTLGCLTQALWEDAEAKAEEQGRKVVNKPRYFYTGTTDEDVVHLLRGGYSSFLAAHILSNLLSEEGSIKAAEQLFHDTSIKALGLNALLTTSDGLVIFGRRSQKVVQARGYLDLPSGGVMPEYYPEGEENPNLYVSAQRQILDELGIEVPEQDLTLLGVVRDDATSKNMALAFTSDLPQTETQVREAFANSRDGYEHDHLVFLPKETLETTLLGGTHKVVGMSLGTVLLKNKKDEGIGSHLGLKSSFKAQGYEVVEV